MQQVRRNVLVEFYYRHKCSNEMYY